MSLNITVAMVQEYKANIEQLTQQHGSRLRSRVRNEPCSGKRSNPINQIGKVKATKLTTRHGPTPRTDTPHSRRWITPNDFAVADWIDSEDQLRMLIDPESAYSQNMRDSLGREIDSAILDSAFGTAYVGEEGTTAETFDTSNWQVAAGGVGLTVTKIRAVNRMLLAAENNQDEEKFIVLSADQIEDLLGETWVVSADYNTVKPLQSGKIVDFLGFTFVHSELILSDGTNDRVLAYAKSGLCLGVWKDIEARISELPEHNYTTQAYARATFGATRTHEAGSTAKGKVAEIQCVP